MELSLQANALDPAAARPRAELIAAGLAVAVFAGLSLLSGIMSEGFLEADGCTHYLYARHALQEPHYLVNVWGRPLCTGLYAVPAALGGLVGVRIMSLLLALVCGVVAYGIARDQGLRWPVLALIFTLAQPLVFLHSFSELTELPFAAVIGLAFWAYQRRQWVAMALLVGLSPLGRPEGFGFLLLAIAALLAHRRLLPLLLLPLPLLAWNQAGWVIYGRQGPWHRWLIDQWPYAAQSLYDPGHLLHFVALLPVVVSPLIFPAAVLGVWRSFLPLRRHRLDRMPHVLRCRVLAAAIPLMILAGHSLLYWLGKMASNGEIRYMLVVAPFWALLAARGWVWMIDRFNLTHPLRWVAVAALAPILANIVYPVVPLVLHGDFHRARTIAEFYRGSAIAQDHPRLLASHPALFYFLEISPFGSHTVEWNEATVRQPPPGVLLIWDSIYGLYNSDAQRSVSLEEIEQAGWVRVTDAVERTIPPRPDTGEWEFFLSPRTAEGAPAQWKTDYRGND